MLSKTQSNLLPNIMIMMGVVFSIVVGVLSLKSPLLVFVMIVFGLVGLFSLSYPNRATQVFMFILYSNAAVVATKFHGVPLIIAATFPLILCIPFVYMVVIRRQQIIVNSNFLMMAGLLLVQIVGTILSIDVGTASETLVTFVIEGILLYFLIINVIRTTDQLRRVVFVIFLSTIFLGIFPIIQYVTGTEDNNYFGFAQTEDLGFTISETLTAREIQARYSGAIGEENRFAQTMFMLMMLAFPHITSKESVGWKSLAILTVGIAAFAGVLSFSRGAAVGLGITFAIAVILRLFSWKHIMIIAACCLLIFITTPQYLIRITSLSSVSSLLGIETEQIDYEGPDGALEGRATQMLAANIIFSEYPIFGVGPGMFKFYAQDIGNQLNIKRLDDVRRSHSLYFDILSNTGILGFLLTMGIVYFTLRDLLRVKSKLADKHPFLSTTANGFILAILSYMATGIFLHFAYIRYFWVTIAVAACIIRISAHYINLDRVATTPAVIKNTISNQA
jgi:putative inorganic carbon (hco3(-)) transporter